MAFHHAVGALVVSALALAACGDDEETGAGGGGGSTSSSVASGDAGGGSPTSTGSAGGGGSPAPTPWELLESGTTEDLHALFIEPSGALLVAGDGGTLLRSDDGVAFAPLESGTTEDLRGVWSSGTVVYAVGAAGTIVRSLDGGASFDAVVSGVSSDLEEVWGASPDLLFATGEAGTILRSTDGGDAWTPRPNAAITTIHGVFGLDATYVFASAEGSLLASSDGGDTWALTVVSLYPQLDVWAKSPTDVYTVNTVSVVTYDDGSATLQKTIISPTAELAGITGRGQAELFAVGQAGTIFTTDDAGEDWVGEESGVADYLYDVQASAEDVYAVGAAGRILRR